MANPIVGSYGSPQSIYESFDVTATNQTRAVGHHKVGTRGYLPDGRVFYYASNGAVALAAGRPLIALALSRSTSHDKTPLTSSFANWATGQRDGILLDDTDANADFITNEYAEGYLWYENQAGQGGEHHKIRGHTSGDTSATSTTEGAKFDLYDALTGDAVGTDELSFCRNPWDRVVSSAGNEEELTVGVCPIVVAASTAIATDVDTAVSETTTRFFWAQTWGPAAVEVDDTTVAIGIACGSADTANRVEAHITGEFVATSGTTATLSSAIVGVGMGILVGATGDFQEVFLKISA